MNTGEVLLTAILADPSDDLPRLAFADWCYEIGDDQRAELIRLQIADPGETSRTGQLLAWNWGKWMPEAWMMEGDKQSFWRVNNPEYFPMALFTRGFISAVRLPQKLWLDSGRELVKVHPLKRVDLSDCEPDTDGANNHGWLNVDAMNREYSWWNTHPDGRFYLPETLWDQMPRGVSDNNVWKFYPTRRRSMNALSVACLKWAKRSIPVAEVVNA